MTTETLEKISNNLTVELEEFIHLLTERVRDIQKLIVEDIEMLSIEQTDVKQTKYFKSVEGEIQLTDIELKDLVKSIHKALKNIRFESEVESKYTTSMSHFCTFYLLNLVRAKIASEESNREIQEFLELLLQEQKSQIDFKSLFSNSLKENESL